MSSLFQESLISTILRYKLFITYSDIHYIPMCHKIKKKKKNLVVNIIKLEIMYRVTLVEKLRAKGMHTVYGD